MSLTLRVRFPDGRAMTLRDLASTLLYDHLLQQIQTRAKLQALPQKLIVAGPPRRLVTPSQGATIGALLRSGDSLIVEPANAFRPSRTPPPRTRAKTSTGACKLLPEYNDDDEDDVNWAPDGEACADKPSKRPVRKTARKSARKRQKTGFQTRGHRLGNETDIAQAEDDAKVPDVPDVTDVPEVPEVPDVTAGLGVAIVDALQQKAKDLDVTGRKFRDGLASALAERQAEAEGERRVEAVLAGRYKISDVTGGTFRVEYGALGTRKWTKEYEDGEIVAFPRELLAAAFKMVVDSGVEEEKERLRMRNMASVSVRSFWNMVRLFGQDIEGGLRELVPDAEWSFLNHRKRMRSAKGKRNDENKNEMGWSSD